MPAAWPWRASKLKPAWITSLRRSERSIWNPLRARMSTTARSIASGLLTKAGRSAPLSSRQLTLPPTSRTSLVRREVYASAQKSSPVPAQYLGRMGPANVESRKIREPYARQSRPARAHPEAAKPSLTARQGPSDTLMTSMVWPDGGVSSSPRRLSASRVAAVSLGAAPLPSAPVVCKMKTCATFLRSYGLDDASMMLKLRASMST
mmetsp:Transcript_28105/g.89846  ORF Transcript_28105/g.89846 Transcript_28105/m.89846 type:complete len:206 (+) Transcript_28105:3793-4410(+)